MLPQDGNQRNQPIPAQRTYLDYSKNALQNINQKYNDHKNSALRSQKPILIKDRGLFSNRETPLIPIWTNIRSHRMKNEVIQPLRPPMSFSQDISLSMKQRPTKLSFSHAPSSQGIRENRSKSALRGGEYDELFPLNYNSNSPIKRDGVRSAQETLMSRKLANLGSPQKAATFVAPSLSYTNSPEKIKLYTDGDQMDRIRFNRAHSHRVPIRSSYNGNVQQRNPNLYSQKESHEAAIARLIESNVVKYMDYLKEKPQEARAPIQLKQTLDEDELDKEVSFILEGGKEGFRHNKKRGQFIMPERIESRLIVQNRQKTPIKQTEQIIEAKRPVSNEVSKFERVFNPSREQTKDFIIDDEEAGPRVYFNFLDAKEEFSYE